MTVDELLRNPRRRDYAAAPETDALVVVDGLLEADLLDIRLVLTEVSLALLFDLRNALRFRMPDMAVLVMRGITQVVSAWDESPGHRWLTHPVVGSNPVVKGGFFTFELACERGFGLNAVSASAEFFVGDVPDLPAAPPDFGEDDEPTIAAGMPAWNSTFMPRWATFVDPGTSTSG